MPSNTSSRAGLYTLGTISCHYTPACFLCICFLLYERKVKELVASACLNTGRNRRSSLIKRKKQGRALSGRCVEQDPELTGSKSSSSSLIPSDEGTRIREGERIGATYTFISLHRQPRLFQEGDSEDQNCITTDSLAGRLKEML